MMTMKRKMKEPGWRKKRERTKDLTGIEREREKGKMPTLEISCVPSLVISTTSKLDHTETKADPKLLLNSFYMYLT